MLLALLRVHRCGRAGQFQPAPTSRTGHYQEVGDRERAVSIARLAAPYMHARLHAVAGTDGVSRPPVRDEQSLATIARKVALAFRLAVGEEKVIEDAGDGVNGEARQRLTAMDATSTIGGAVAAECRKRKAAYCRIATWPILMICACAYAPGAIASEISSR